MATVERGGPNRNTLVTALKWGVPLAGLAALLSIGINNNTCPSSGAIWLRYTIFGLRSGAIYAMIALGYTMVYGVLQLLNFAHSEVFMIGTFAGLYTIKGLFSVAGVPVDRPTVLVLVVAVAMLIVLDRFVHGTRTGQGIRAVAEDPETASLMGVNVDRIIVITFLVGGLMAGVAGSLFGIFFGQAQFNIGFVPGIKAFTAAVLGGIGNIRGAMLGGLLLGLIENYGVACIGAQWQEVFAFLVLVGVLMFRPTGLLGERVGG